MDNQHRQIKGYRELSQDEIDLMNEIKEEGVRLQALIAKVREHVAAEAVGVDRMRADAAEPARWASIARTDFQTGLMALTRAIAQPTFF